MVQGESEKNLAPHCLDLRKQIGAQHIPQDWQVKRFVQYLGGACEKGAVGSFFDVARSRPGSIDYHGNVARGEVRFQTFGCFIAAHFRQT